MADYNPKGQNVPAIPSEENETPMVENLTPEQINTITFDDPEPLNEVNGLSDEEQRDPNKIKVNITDDRAPIVILYGPPSCGKTMTLARLTRYLQSEGYTVEPERGFRPTADRHYKKLCEEFDQMMNSDDAATSTSLISFMLVKVYKNARCLCQILEAPGEYYFTKDSPNAPYPYYFQTIKSARNRKVWAIMVEPNWEDPQDRKNYVSRIQKLKSQIRSTDKVIFVYNKIDLTSYVNSPGNVNVGAAQERVKQDYPNLFIPFKNTNPISRFWRDYDCGFVPFQTGEYTEAADGKLSFAEGPIEYPRNLWKEILNQVEG